MHLKLSIGDFSRMTYLSVKALRHYHDVGVLDPVEIDPATGYRFYAPSQIGLAQMIRRLRDLGMPLEEVRTIVQAPDARTRDETLVAHLRRLEEQLARTQQSVASLRPLLQPPDEALDVVRRDLPVTPSVAVVERGCAPRMWWPGGWTPSHCCTARSAAQVSPDRAGTGRCSRRSSSPTSTATSSSSCR